MKHGLIKIASAVPETAYPASPRRNGETICRRMEEAYGRGCRVLVLPALSLTGVTCGSLFYTDRLLAEAEGALGDIIAYSCKVPELLTFVGLPVRYGNRLYNCAAAVLNGRLLGLTPKTTLSAAEVGEKLYFAPWDKSQSVSVAVAGQWVPMGTDFLYTCEAMPELQLGCVIGEDFRQAARLAEAGATVLVRLGDGCELIGREDYRRTLAKADTGRMLCALAEAMPGAGESTTDFVWGGHCLVAAGGNLLSESLPFAGEGIACAVVDLRQLRHDRLQGGTADAGGMTGVPFAMPLVDTDLAGADGTSVVEPCPFFPTTMSEGEKAAVCARILDIQAHGLARRITAAHASGLVIALSGGLDSTLALVVTVRAMDILGRDRKEILSVTMPCFGTTGRTRSNAEELAVQFGTDFCCIDIKEAVDVHFRDIGHDASDLSVVYENAQARERTQIIMDLANGRNGLVIGTGDLSELALGWATYNGDHMSNYGVNGGIPKTLVRRVVEWYASVCEEVQPGLAAVLRDILATPVSPELLPPKDGDIAQRTEDIVGPYDLHDFFLYHFVRWGEEPEKIRRLAEAAFRGRFTPEVIEGWLKIFLRRFFTQQFKRSALPDGPKVGTVGLSPRGDWHMPSDGLPWTL